MARLDLADFQINFDEDIRASMSLFSMLNKEFGLASTTTLERYNDNNHSLQSVKLYSIEASNDSMLKQNQGNKPFNMAAWVQPISSPSEVSDNSSLGHSRNSSFSQTSSTHSSNSEERVAQQLEDKHNTSRHHRHEHKRSDYSVPESFPTLSPSVSPSLSRRVSEFAQPLSPSDQSTLSQLDSPSFPFQRGPRQQYSYSSMNSHQRRISLQEIPVDQVNQREIMNHMNQREHMEHIQHMQQLENIHHAQRMEEERIQKEHIVELQREKERMTRASLEKMRKNISMDQVQQPIKIQIDDEPLQIDIDYSKINMPTQIQINPPMVPQGTQRHPEQRPPRPPTHETMEDLYFGQHTDDEPIQPHLTVFDFPHQPTKPLAYQNKQQPLLFSQAQPLAYSQQLFTFNPRQHFNQQQFSSNQQSLDFNQEHMITNQQPIKQDQSVPLPPPFNKHRRQPSAISPERINQPLPDPPTEDDYFNPQEAVLEAYKQAPQVLVPPKQQKEHGDFEMEPITEYEEEQEAPAMWSHGQFVQSPKTLEHDAQQPVGLHSPTPPVVAAFPMPNEDCNMAIENMKMLKPSSDNIGSKQSRLSFMSGALRQLKLPKFGNNNTSTTVGVVELGSSNPFTAALSPITNSKKVKKRDFFSLKNGNKIHRVTASYGEIRMGGRSKSNNLMESDDDDDDDDEVHGVPLPRRKSMGEPDLDRIRLREDNVDYENSDGDNDTVDDGHPQQNEVVDVNKRFSKPNAVFISGNHVRASDHPPPPPPPRISVEIPPPRITSDIEHPLTPGGTGVSLQNLEKCIPPQSVTSKKLPDLSSLSSLSILPTISKQAIYTIPPSTTNMTTADTTMVYIETLNPRAKLPAKTVYPDSDTET